MTAWFGLALVGVIAVGLVTVAVLDYLDRCATPDYGEDRDEETPRQEDPPDQDAEEPATEQLPAFFVAPAPQEPPYFDQGHRGAEPVTEPMPVIPGLDEPAQLVRSYVTPERFFSWFATTAGGHHDHGSGKHRAGGGRHARHSERPAHHRQYPGETGR
jgi:hypothetical protein